MDAHQAAELAAFGVTDALAFVIVKLPTTAVTV